MLFDKCICSFVEFLITTIALFNVFVFIPKRRVLISEYFPGNPNIWIIRLVFELMSYILKLIKQFFAQQLYEEKAESSHACSLSRPDKQVYLHSLHKTPNNGIPKKLLRKRKDKLWKCPYCTFKTKNIWIHDVHVRNHTEIKLQCHYCSYKTAHRLMMKGHLRKHTGEMLKCTRCWYKTKWVQRLNEHIRKHTDDVLKCSLCPYKTIEIRKIMRHLRKHNKNSSETTQGEVGSSS